MQGPSAQHPRIDRVLIVDDYAGMRRTLRSMLRSLGFEHILEAESGAQALALLENAELDLVISDWKMSPMSGLELLRQVRTIARLQALPFIMLTATASEDFVTSARAAGVNAYLVKPVSLTTLRQVIERVRAGGAGPRPPELPSAELNPALQALKDLWSSKLRDGVAPSRQELDPAEILSTWKQSVIVKFWPDEGRAQFAFAGDAVRRAFDMDLTGLHLDEVFGPSDAAATIQFFHEALAGGSPIYRELLVERASDRRLGLIGWLALPLRQLVGEPAYLIVGFNKVRAVRIQPTD